ncbi:hypothetical protein [Nocardia sp. NPDC052566]|uniref:hypothetical protein n=1 Tax=Nocardia sp. NPDC052566 TaxID=3364330 RepID=UPI0037C679E6
MRHHWLRRITGRRATPVRAPATPDDTGTDLVLAWIGDVTAGLANPPPGPPESAAARSCDGLFTAAALSAVLIEKVDPRPEYRIANRYCLAAAIEFMKALGEETLRRYRIRAATPVGWERMTADLDERAIAAKMIQLGEALQLTLCAVTIDATLTTDIRDVADDFGLPAAAAIVDSFQTVLTHPDS